MHKIWTAVRNGFKSYRLCLTAIALNIPVLFAILMLNVAGENPGPVTWIYVATLAGGYYGLPLLLIGTILYLLFLPARRGAKYVAVIILSTIIYYFLIDSLVFGIFKFHLDLFWIEYALEDFQSLGLTHSTIASLVVFLAGVIAIQIGIFRLSMKSRALQNAAKWFPLAAILMFGASQIMHIVAYHWNDERITKISPLLPLYIPFHSHSDAEKFRALMPWIGEDDGASTGEPVAGSLHYPLQKLEFQDMSGDATPNIIIIMLESWRYDAMNETTCPNIFSLGERSTVCLDHLSSGNQTTCGIFGFFYGLHPTYWSAVKANATSIDNPELIDVLRNSGYALGIYARSNFERHKIKDTIFNGYTIHEEFAGKTIYEQDADMTARMLDFITEHERTGTHYLAYAFYKSSHAPYTFPPDYAPPERPGSDNMAFANGNTDPAYRLSRYDAALKYEDMLVGRIIDRLDSLATLDETVIIITTDHGESFNDNKANYWGHGSSYTRYQVQVPMIFHAPGHAARQVTFRTGHIDIVPTLLEEYFGCITDSRVYSNGRNLFKKPDTSRPLVVGSYFNHAFIFWNNVYEILPFYTKKYTLTDVTGQPSPPNPSLLKAVAEEIGRFADSGHTSNDRE